METNLTAPTRRTRRTLTAAIVAGSTVAERADTFRTAYTYGADRTAIPPMVRDARRTFADIRTRHGFAMVDAPTILTPPAANLKLDKGEAPAYGLTLQSFVTTLSDGSRVNACPNAGHCVRVCVLNNGNGRYDSVQRARDARSEFLAADPLAALTLIGWEVGRAVRRHGAITFRPNVNSDVDWWEVLGDTLRTLFGVTSYGYTKRDTSGTPDALTFEALSWGERTTPAMLAAAVAAGRPIAAVTSRRPGDPIRQWSTLPGYRVVDADLTDEWMFDSHVIGDLSAKGDARNLIGRSGFVHDAY